MTNHIAPLYAL